MSSTTGSFGKSMRLWTRTPMTSTPSAAEGASTLAPRRPSIEQMKSLRVGREYGMKHLVSSLILASVLIAPGVSAEARSHWPSGLGGHHGKFWKRGDVRRKLELTEDQVRSLEQIFATNQQTLADLEADVKKKRADFDALLADDRDDDKRIMAEVDLLEQARANLGKARVTMLLAMRKILTQAQRQKLRGEHERREGGDWGSTNGGRRETMIWRFRFPNARMRLRGKARDRQDSAPSLDEVRTRTQQQFH